MSDEEALNSSHLEDPSYCLSAKFEDECRQCFELIGAWSDREQVEFIKQCLGKSSLDQLSHVYAHLLSLLRRDFVSLCSGKKSELRCVLSICPSHALVKFVDTCLNYFYY